MITYYIEDSQVYYIDRIIYNTSSETLSIEKKKKQIKEDSSGSIYETCHNIPCVCTLVASVQLPAQIKRNNMCDSHGN